MNKHFIFLLLIFASFHTFAQSGINARNTNNNTYLHIDEGTGAAKIYKGVIPSRYSTADRNTKFVGLGVSENGLLIYNTTENCYNYWKHNGTTGTWVSLCGCLPGTEPIKYYANCGAATVSPATLKRGVAISGGTITVPIVVVNAGTINASSQTINGVTFSNVATAVTQATTSYTINFSGTPTSGTQIVVPIKDNNGVTICNVTIALTYVAEFVCTASPLSNIQGTYNLDYPLTTANTFNVTYNVTAPGTYPAMSLTGGGMTFTAPAGTFTTTGSNTVTFTASPIQASNTPTTFGINSLTGSGSPSGCTIALDVTYGNAEITCAGTVLGGNYFVETNLTSAEKVTMNFTVAKRGNAVIVSEDKNGIKFGLNTVFTTLGAVNSIDIPNVPASFANPQTAEEASLGANGANNQSASYAFTNNGTAMGCSVTIDVKPKLITGAIINSSLANWNTAGFTANGATDSRIRLEMSTKLGSGTSQFWNVPVRNISGNNITYDINGSSTWDSYRLNLTNVALINNNTIGSIDPYNPLSNRVGANANGDNGAHAGNYAGGREESEAGLLVLLNGNWYKYRVMFNTEADGTANYIILYGIYSSKPSMYLTTTSFGSKNANPLSYWP